MSSLGPIRGGVYLLPSVQQQDDAMSDERPDSRGRRQGRSQQKGIGVRRLLASATRSTHYHHHHTVVRPTPSPGCTAAVTGDSQAMQRLPWPACLVAGIRTRMNPALSSQPSIWSSTGFTSPFPCFLALPTPARPLTLGHAE